VQILSLFGKLRIDRIPDEFYPVRAILKEFDVLVILVFSESQTEKSALLVILREFLFHVFSPLVIGV
jgi:hypothetical protein